MIVLFIITLFHNSCIDSLEITYCNLCKVKGQWVNKGNPYTPCFKTEADCKDWIQKNVQINQDCVLCN